METAIRTIMLYNIKYWYYKYNCCHENDDKYMWELKAIWTAMSYKVFENVTMSHCWLQIFGILRAVYVLY